MSAINSVVAVRRAGNSAATQFWALPGQRSACAEIRFVLSECQVLDVDLAASGSAAVAQCRTTLPRPVPAMLGFKSDRAARPRVVSLTIGA